MRFHDITKCDMLNGTGLRAVLWVSGCSHRCKGCQNQVAQDPNDGVVFDNNSMNELIEALSPSYIEGLTLSGGDPLYPGNRQEILNIVKSIKDIYPNKNIWLYTGYSYEDISKLEILNYIDVVCDGLFKIELLSPNKKWVGSSNQRVIDIKKTKEYNKIILWED